MDSKPVDVTAQCVMVGDLLLHPLTAEKVRVHHVDRFPQKDSVRIDFVGTKPSIWLNNESLVTIHV